MFLLVPCVSRHPSWTVLMHLGFAACLRIPGSWESSGILTQFFPWAPQQFLSLVGWAFFFPLSHEIWNLPIHRFWFFLMILNGFGLLPPFLYLRPKYFTSFFYSAILCAVLGLGAILWFFRPTFWLPSLLSFFLGERIPFLLGWKIASLLIFWFFFIGSLRYQGSCSWVTGSQAFWLLFCIIGWLIGICLFLFLVFLGTPPLNCLNPPWLYCISRWSHALGNL